MAIRLSAVVFLQAQTVCGEWIRDRVPFSLPHDPGRFVRGYQEERAQRMFRLTSTARRTRSIGGRTALCLGLIARLVPLPQQPERQ